MQVRKKKSNGKPAGKGKYGGTQETETDICSEIVKAIKKCGGSMRSNYSIKKRPIHRKGLGKWLFALKAQEEDLRQLEKKCDQEKW